MINNALNRVVTVGFEVLISGPKNLHELDKNKVI